MAQDGTSSPSQTASPAKGGPAQSAEGALKVFISYSRHDTDFANELLAGLQITGFEPFLDTHDIAPGEPWEDRLGRLIAAADTIVFVISPNSVASEHCQWEVARCEDQGKRLLPIVWQQVEDGKVPDRLKRLNYVYFDKPHSFAPSLAALSEALRTDLGWVREHTRLLARAEEWLAAGKPDNRLLSGKDIADAKAWLAKVGAAQHLKPTELHRDFIQASEQAEALRTSAERQRADMLQNAVQRTRLALAGTAVFLVAALAAAGLAYWSQQAEKQQKLIAEQARADAEASQSKLAVKLAELDRSETALTKYIASTAPKVSDDEIAVHIGEDAISLIVDFEVGGKTQYEKRYSKPEYPGGASGVTIGIGYDLGYHDAEQIASDWAELPKGDIARLVAGAGLTQEAARDFLPKVKDVVIPYDTAMRSFRKKTLAEYGHKTLLIFPGCLDLPPNAFGALVSLVYNRGPAISMSTSRDEMRAMRSLLILQDYKGVAEQFRAMKRLWGAVPGLQKRREAEAKLFESALADKGAGQPAADLAAPVPNSHTP